MKKILLALAMVAAAVSVRDGVARAQIAEALGQPRPMDTLPAGTMTVRIVVGEMSSPVVGVEARLAVNGELRKAITNQEGRAKFEGLAPGTKVQAFADGESGEIQSIEFPMPADTGVAVLLSTVEWKGVSAAPTGKDRPDPRSMSGKARAEQADPAGQITVRVSYDDWDDPAGTAGIPVVMVAYSSDDRIGAKIVDTDVGGRAVFDGLDATGNTAYYAMALLPRDGKDDRLLSSPIVPFEDVGMRLMLSAEKVESGLPIVEDLAKSVPQTDLQSGQVAVAFSGGLKDGSVVELRDVITTKVIATTTTAPAKPLPSSIDAQMSGAQPDSKLPAGTVSVAVAFAIDQRVAALPGVKVTIRAATKAPEPPAPPTAPDAKAPPKDPAPKAPVVPAKPEPKLGTFAAGGTSDDQGVVTITGAPSGIWLEAVAEVEGKTFVGKPFSLDATGAQIQIAATWQSRGLVEAVFENVAPTPRGAYYVEAKVHAEAYRSPPFMVTAGRGVAVPVYVMPRVAMTFQLDCTVEDDYLAANGTFMVQNFSFAPYAGPGEGVRIPAPDGATGLVVAEKDKAWVSADAHDFRLMRPVPPFGGSFRAAFSLPVSDGAVSWDMALPYGSFQSSLAILQTPRMKVTGLPPKARTQVVPQPNGTEWFAIQGVFIAKDKRMIFHITGLPQAPGWQRVARLVAGIAVLFVMIAGIVFTVRKRPAAVIAPSAASKKQRKKQIDDLLERVAVLDRAKEGKDDGRRAALVHELETLYLEDEPEA